MPQGTVSFVLKGHGGRVSDKYITENCGYLYKLQPGDVVLADRGFNVQQSVAYRGATLNIPAFTKRKAQLPAVDVEETLANVMIHVERVIGAVRQRLQILSATTPLPTEYTKSKKGSPILLDSIVRCCCALHNVCDVIIPTEWILISFSCVHVNHSELSLSDIKKHVMQCYLLHWSYGSIERYKACLVAQGYSQKEGLDYDETFSPVVRSESVCSVTVIASKNGLKLHQMDITTAFLNGDLEEEVYMNNLRVFSLMVRNI